MACCLFVAAQAANNQVGAKQIHSNDNNNDDIQQLKLDLTATRGSLASIEKHMETIVNHIIPRMENCRPSSQGPSAAPVVRNLCGFVSQSLPFFFYFSFYGDEH